MKKILFFLSALFIVSCSNDDVNETNFLVQVTTVSSSILQDGGVTLNGKIINFEPTANYGFVIATYQGGTLNINNPGLLKKTLNGTLNGSFSMDFRNNLVQDQIYYYSAYLFDNNTYTFGEEKHFISNGSASPVIELVEPPIAHIGDTIVIKGNYFSNENTVYFDDVLATTIVETDTLIKTIVPFHYSREEPYNSITLEKETGEESIFNDFSMYSPVVTSVTPNIIYESDIITIHGDHFSLENNQNILSLDYNGNYVEKEIIESSRTEIKFVNNGSYTAMFPKLKLKSQFQTIEINDQFQIKMPTITSAPDCIRYGENAIIYGTDFPNVGGQFDSEFYLKIGGRSFSAIEIHRDYIVFNVDDGFYSDLILHDVTINYLGQEITFEKEICIDEPWVKVSFDNPKHQPHNYLNETYGVVSQNNSTFVTVGKLNTESHHFESVTNTQLPEDIRYGNLRTWKNDKLYHYDTSPNINKFYSYNYLNGSLDELTPFPGSQRKSGLMTTVGDYIYLGFGIDNNYNAFSDLWKYSITNNTWEMVLNFPGITSYQNAITDPLVFSFDNNRLFFASAQSETNAHEFWEIDLISNTLISKAPTPISPYEQKGTTIGNKGYFENFYLYEYDVDTDVWTTHQNINGIGFMYPSSRESLFTNNGNFFRSVTTSSPYYNLLFKMNMNYLE